MDRLEAARRIAEEIHQAAVAAGDDPTKLLGLVKAEAARRNVTLYAVTAGDPQLKGGLAVFDSQAQTVLYQDCGDDFDRAFLIAHELGHVILGGGFENAVAVGVESDRSAEETPVGAERVLDYGAKERREVRMDLFARELLLPRSAAVRMHVEQGLSAEAIARRIGARLPMVQQQLLDALLLPPVASSVGQSAPSVTSDDSQGEAVRHGAGPFLLQAGPGTGKTRTLVERVGRLVSEGVAPESILVLTFSNKAAGELVDRIAVCHPEAAGQMWIGTFHSFGLDLVRRFHEKLRLTPDPRIVDRAEAIELLEDELPRLPLKHFRNLWDPTLDLADMLTAISRAKDEVIDATGYRALAEAMLAKAGPEEEVRKPAEKCVEVATLFELYEKIMAAEQAVDFGDLITLPVKLLESDEGVRDAVRSRHAHILVDEYQDVNHASVRLLKAVAGEGRHLWAVGDARQSIYRFRGAASTNIAQFGNDFPGATMRQLEVNYRSNEEIVQTFAEFSREMLSSASTLPLQLRANRGSGNHQPEHRNVEMPDDEISAVAGAIRERHDGGVKYHQQAVLCASNARVRAMAEGLEERGIPVLHLGSLFERPEVKDLLAMLSLLGDARATGLVRLGGMPAYRMPLQDVAAILHYASENDVAPGAWKEVSAKVVGLGGDSMAALSRVAELLEGFTPASGPWTVLAHWVIDRLGLAKTLHQKGDLACRMQGLALWQFLNFCRKQPTRKGLPIRRLLDRIRRLILLSEDRGLQQLPACASGIDAVRLLTIHGAKGLEFEVVHLPGLVVSGLPRSYRPPRVTPPDGLIHAHADKTGIEAVRIGHEEEEECLFFVGLSRARDHLFIYSHQRQDARRVRNPSAYLERVRPFLSPVANPLLIPGPSVALETISVDWTALPSWSDSEINQFERCPRRFFYTYVLRLHGQRTDTPFLQMHYTVFDVLAWLKEKHLLTHPEPAEVDAAFADAWQRKGAVDHGYAEDYLRIGRQMVDYYLQVRRSLALAKVDPITLSLPGCTVVVQPDIVADGPGGKVVVRRMKSGKKPSGELDDLEFGILQLAATHAYGERAQVEVSFLTSGESVPLDLTFRKLKSRQESMREIATQIRAGDYPATEKDKARTCPRCPSFYICGPVPAGPLRIKN